MTQMSTVKINLKQIKRIKRGQSKKDPNCRVRHLTGGSRQVLLAPLRCCHHKPAGSCCHRGGSSIKGEQRWDQNSFKGPKQPCQLTRRLCGSPSQNQTVASSDISANEQSLTSISAVFVTSTISCKVFNRAFHQFYFNPPPDREELGGTWWWAWKIGQLCLRRVLD